MKKFTCLIIVLLIVLSLSTLAFAQDVDEPIDMMIDSSEYVLSIGEEIDSGEVQWEEDSYTQEPILIEESENEEKINTITFDGETYYKEKIVDGGGNATILQNRFQTANGAPENIPSVTLTENDIGKKILNEKYQGYNVPFVFIPKRSGDYQISLELDNWENGFSASYLTDDRDFVEMSVFNYEKIYENYYLKAGKKYSFSFGLVKSITLKKDAVQATKIGEKQLTTNPEDSLFKFVAPKDGTYEFKAEGDKTKKPWLRLLMSGYLEPQSTENKELLTKSIALKKGQQCYPLVGRIDWLTVSHTADKDFVQVDDMWLQRNWTEPISSDAKFSINQSTGRTIAVSSLKKPWFIIHMNVDSNASTPVLTNSNGKVIKWTYDSIAAGNKKRYGVQLGTDGKTRTYKLTVTPESGNKSKAKIYTICVNPKPSKPGSFKATPSKSSNSVTLSWKKSDSASGYKLYRATSKSGTYKVVKTITKGSTVKYTDQKLTKGKTYFYKLVPYITINGKNVNGTRTSVIKATVRK